MANTIAIKRRIQAAQNVSKTTKAMQMIAASKLKRAQQSALSVRPYVEKLTELTQNVSSKIDEESTHPYMRQGKITGKTLLVVLSPDKGLCGSLITNLLKEFLQYRCADKNVEYLVVGKKLEGKIASLGNEIIASFAFGTVTPTFDIVYPIFHIIEDYFLSKKVDTVKILSTSFDGVFSQKPKITTILPVIIPQVSNENKQEEDFHVLEPSADEILPSLLKHYLEMVIYQNLIESFVSEQASRMITMQNATDNANDIIEELKLEYNKSRQAKITNEILDIGSSANMNYE